MILRGFYGIADTGFGTLPFQVEQLISGGACAIQLRGKHWPISQLEEAAKTVYPLCISAEVPLILNDVYLPHCSDGMHLGQSDGSFDRKELPPAFWVGRSTHTLAQLHEAIAEGVDYVGFGPVFPTGTKVNPGPAVGLQILAEAARHSVPVVAIGGIRLDRLADLQATGVHAWTAISAVWRSADPLQAIQAFSKPSG